MPPEDNCPDDPDKLEPGLCGCGTPDIDSDGDSYMDCEEVCLDDPAKQDPGACGCGVVDTDKDGDGTADCIDECPDDPEATSGECGLNGGCDCTNEYADSTRFVWSAMHCRLFPMYGFTEGK